jgi:hypothetical protein
MDEGREGLTDIDRALAQALDVEPSAEFRAAVRQRVARERMRVPLSRGWLLLVPISAAAIVVVVAVLSPPAKPETPGGAVIAPTTSVARLEPGLNVTPAKPGAAPGPKVAPARAASGGAAAVRRATHPEVLVPRAEIEMYQRLIAGARAVPGAVVVEAPADLAASRTFADITVDPITIDPIAPPEGGEGVRQ